MISTRPVYANVGQRLAAWLIDSLLFGLLMVPLVNAFFEPIQYTPEEAMQILQTQGITGIIDINQLLFQQGIILCVTVFFWVRFLATPGKRLMNIVVVDAKTLQPLSIQQSVIRYLGYFVSAFPMFMGFFWAVMDEKQQTWHDKFADSIVIKRQGQTQQSPRSTAANSKQKQSADDDIFAA